MCVKHNSSKNWHREALCALAKRSQLLLWPVCVLGPGVIRKFVTFEFVITSPLAQNMKAVLFVVCLCLPLRENFGGHGDVVKKLRKFRICELPPKMASGRKPCARLFGAMANPFGMVSGNRIEMSHLSPVLATSD